MSTISGLSPGSVGTSTQDAFSSLDTQEFVRIIFSELAHQDPLQPNDSKALLEQLSSLRNIQSGMDLSTKLNALVAQNELSAASGLIGRSVSGVSDDYQRVEGVVQRVIRTNDGAVLALTTGQRIHMSNLDQVLGAPTGGTAT